MEISPSIQEIEIPLVNIIYKKTGFITVYTITACYFFGKYFKSGVVAMVFLAVKKYFKKI